MAARHAHLILVLVLTLLALRQVQGRIFTCVSPVVSTLVILLFLFLSTLLKPDLRVRHDLALERVQLVKLLVELELQLPDDALSLIHDIS